MHSDSRAVFRPEPFLVLAAGLVQVPLVVSGLGLEAMPLGPRVFAVALVLSLALAAAAFTRYNLRLAHMLLYMLFVGNLGMLVGARLDFGASSLLALTHWCHMHPGLELATIIDKLAGAPWTYGLMLVGCNLGMLLSDWIWARSQPHGTISAGRLAHYGTARCYLSCNLGMLAGMLIAEGLMPGGHHHHHIAVGGALAMVAIMAAGMSIGMLIGLWLASGQRRPRRSITATP
jgi:hypothetical protein